MGDGYQLWEADKLVVGFEDGEALARYLMHNVDLLKEPFVVLPVTIARIPKRGRCNEQDV